MDHTWEPETFIFSGRTLFCQIINTAHFKLFLNKDLIVPLIRFNQFDKCFTSGDITVFQHRHIPTENLRN